jgi:type I restriction-modification system DNA methylase subunit
VLYLPEAARFSALIQVPEGANIGAAINDAMRAIEAENPDLKDVLPKTYNRFENALLKELLKTMNSVPMDIEGDAFGKIYEYFLGHFAMSEGQKGGEFFTPTAIVQLIVGIIEPFHGRIFDPACGSGGMFVQSARFVAEHRNQTLPSPSGRGAGGEGGSAGTLSVYGQEKVAETVRLGKMNLAVHGLAGDIRQGNAYYEDLHCSVEQPSPQSSPKGRGSQLPSTSGRRAGDEGARYMDVPGLCRVATLPEIEAPGWSLNPGRYVGVAAREEDDFDFKERLEEQNEELETLNAEARELEERIAENVVKLLETH